MDNRFTISEAAEYLKCSASKLRDMIRKGQAPPYYKVGNRYIFRQSKLDEWMENGGNEG